MRLPSVVEPPFPRRIHRRCDVEQCSKTCALQCRMQASSSPAPWAERCQESAWPCTLSEPVTLACPRVPDVQLRPYCPFSKAGALRKSSGCHEACDAACLVEQREKVRSPKKKVEKKSPENAPMQSRKTKHSRSFLASNPPCLVHSSLSCGHHACDVMWLAVSIKEATKRQKKRRTAAPRIPAWSPTAVLTRRYLA